MNVMKGGDESVRPVPMVIHCPECKMRHIDEGEFATKEHHTHSCQGCGFTWRPAVVPTVGARFLPGFKSSSETREAVSSEINVVSFEVIYIDQVNEGLAVWALHDEFIETETLASSVAEKLSKECEYEAAKVVRVVREEVAHFWKGEKR